MKKYTALIVDLKKSKSYSVSDRNLIQKKIFETFQRLNKIFKTSIEKEVEFSAGDEIQGLFSSVEAAYLYLRIFQLLILPVEIYAGLGIGDWDIVLEEASTTAQDGSAYHNARKAIEEAKKSLEHSILFYAGEENDKIVNSLIAAADLILKKQNEYQNKVTLITELFYPISIYDIVDIKKINELLFEETKSLFSFSKREVLKTTATNVMGDSDNFFITHGKKRGLSTQLSEILRVTRQSIEKTIKSANIYELRNLVIATLYSMKKY